MIFIYGHIFIIIRRHQLSRQTLTQHMACSSSSLRQNTLNSHNGSIGSAARYHPCSDRCHRSSNGSTSYASQPGSLSRRAYPPIQRNNTVRNMQRNTNADGSNASTNSGVRKNIKVSHSVLYTRRL